MRCHSPTHAKFAALLVKVRLPRRQHSGNSGRGILFPRRRASSFPWSGAEPAAGKLDDKARAKRLCQSCGLPVSQVLMCTLSATLAEKIGQARSLSTATMSGTQTSPPPARTAAFPAPRIRLGDTAEGAGGNYPCATLSQSHQ